MPRRAISALQHFLNSEATGGVILMLAAAAALVVANSPLADGYHDMLHAKAGGLSLHHWINDGLMALFFLLVGLEIKREVVSGELSTRKRRILPAFGAIGGMAVPALVFVAFNLANPEALRGWGIPAATDIAFALGVMSLAGKAVPKSLKTFLVALAIIDDLGAVLIIALFYTAGVEVWALAAAAGLLIVLVAMNRLGVRRLWAYLVVGAALWFAMLKSGVHPTLAGVVLALCIPMQGGRDESHSPLHVLEHALAPWVGFLILPIFAFANAGVSLAGVNPAALAASLPLGVAAGLFIGKQAGVFLAARLAIRLGWAERPTGAGWRQLYAASVLCGVGFTMSLFIGMLAFEDAASQDAVKLGVLVGSLASGLLGWAILRFWSGPRGVRAGG